MEAPLLGTEWIPLPFDACLDPLDLGTEDGLLAFLKSSEFELPEAPVLPQQHFCYEQQQPVASAATPSTSSCAETTAALGPCPSPPTASGPATATATQPVILRQAVARGPRSRCLAAALAQQQQQATVPAPAAACSNTVPRTVTTEAAPAQSPAQPQQQAQQQQQPGGMAGSKLGARKQPAAAPSKSGEASKPTPGNSATRDLDADMDSEDSNDTDEEAMHLDEQPGQKGSKRKAPEVDWRSIEDPAERRRQRRLAKNRVTAARSRERKKAQWGEMEAKLASLEAENSGLKAMLEEMARDNAHLREQLDAALRGTGPFALGGAGAGAGAAGQASRGGICGGHAEPAVLVALVTLLFVLTTSVSTLPASGEAQLAGALPLLMLLAAALASAGSLAASGRSRRRRSSSSSRSHSSPASSCLPDTDSSRACSPAVPESQQPTPGSPASCSRACHLLAALASLLSALRSVAAAGPKALASALRAVLGQQRKRALSTGGARGLSPASPAASQQQQLVEVKQEPVVEVSAPIAAPAAAPAPATKKVKVEEDLGSLAAALGAALMKAEAMVLC